MPEVNLSQLNKSIDRWMANHNVSIESRRKLVLGPAARPLMTQINRTTAPFEWRDPSGHSLPSHGSVFFLDTGQKVLAVTARHVYEEYLIAKERDPGVICQINNLRFNPQERLIALGRDCDVSTFELTLGELGEIDRTTIPWPPVVPAEGEFVAICGFPIEGKKWVGSQVELRYYTSFADVDSVNDRDISTVKRPNEELVDIAGKGLPPNAYDLGGMSGGPMIIFRESAGILSWQIAGVIYECHIGFQIVKAVRADVISPTGTIDR